MNTKETTLGWRAPSNIALIKYWGKKWRQLPMNGSLSITLDKSSTTTFLSYRMKQQVGESIDAEYFFHGEQHPKFEQKIILFLHSLLPEMPFLTDYQLVFRSENNFPHSTGIASSASSMAALALCLVTMEEEIAEIKTEKADFFRRASFIARLGSGSASRSVYGGLAAWGYTASIQFSSDEYAIPFPLKEGSRLNGLMDAILIVSTKEKAIPSTSGHAQMTDHPYREGRVIQANDNLAKLTHAIHDENFKQIAEIAENEALSLHSLLISSFSGGMLLHPNTLLILEEIKYFRETTGSDLFFTIDAGPNVHLIYYEDEREMILQFIEQKLIHYCENGRWIDDRIGSGPTLINPETEI